jgi:hypothetical protein
LDERAKQNQVASFLDTMRKREKMAILKTHKETKANSPVKGKPAEDLDPFEDPMEKGKEIDRKNGFLSKWRPNEQPRKDELGSYVAPCWNFIEEEDPVPHILRVNADPTQAYIDHRIENTLDIIKELSTHLKTYKKQFWDQLLEYELNIFKTQENAEHSEYEEWEKS